MVIVFLLLLAHGGGEVLKLWQTHNHQGPCEEGLSVESSSNCPHGAAHEDYRFSFRFIDAD